MQQNLIKRDSSSGHWYVRGNSTRGSKASFKDFLVKCLMTSCILILLFMYLEWTFLLEGKFVTMRKHKTLYRVKPLIFGFSGHHNFFFFFGGTGVWTQNFMLVTQAFSTWAILPAPFILVYFSDSVSCFFPGMVSDYNLPTYTSQVAEITNMYYHIHLFLIQSY
jgi:hypothetical protein